MAGGLITDGASTLLVANRRRDGRVDWSTPGGVVDHGETMLSALSREVEEETGLLVTEWARRCWTTEVEFVDLDMHLVAEVHLAGSFAGELALRDPDGIVVEARFLEATAIDERLGTAPPWVAEPMRDWLATPWTDDGRRFVYRAHGREPAAITAVRLDG